jgi:anaerobic magnesium-protoporphyrin IX monomethyl ester cyclase
MKITLINPSINIFINEPHVRELVNQLNMIQSAYKQKKFEEYFPERSWQQIARIDRSSKSKTYWPSYGLLSIAGSLEREGFKVKYLEQAFCEDEGTWANDLEEAAFSDIVGITSLTPSAHNAISIGKKLRTINNDVYIVFGGIDATYRSGSYLGVGDLVVLGEGEQTFLNIASTPGATKLQIPGIAWQLNNTIIRNEPAPPLNLDTLSPPSYHLLSEKLRRLSVYYIHSSRGCPYNCNFCAETAFWGHNVRFKSTTAILEEIKSLFNNFDVTSGIIHFADSTFTLRPETELNELVEELRRRFPDLIYNCNLRGEKKDIAICRLLAEGNFFGYTIGMESGSENMLKRMNKRIKHSGHTAFLQAAKEFLPIVESHWIFGFPGETFNTAEKTIDTVVTLLKKDLITEAWPKIYIPYPGTLPYDNPALFDMQILSHEYSKYLRVKSPPYKLNTVRCEDIFSLWTKCMTRIIKTLLDISPELNSCLQNLPTETIRRYPQ